MAEDKVVFMDTGGGDIYGGPTREAVIAAMRKDMGNDDFVEADGFEVDGDMKMSVENEDGPQTISTLSDQYTPQEDGEGYCVASENC